MVVIQLHYAYRLSVPQDQRHVLRVLKQLAQVREHIGRLWLVDAKTSPLQSLGRVAASG